MFSKEEQNANTKLDRKRKPLMEKHFVDMGTQLMQVLKKKVMKK